jgi:hypothetical protein
MLLRAKAWDSKKSKKGKRKQKDSGFALFAFLAVQN